MPSHFFFPILFEILDKVLRAVVMESFWENPCHSWNQAFCSIANDMPKQDTVNK